MDKKSSREANRDEIGGRMGYTHSAWIYLRAYLFYRQTDSTRKDTRVVFGKYTDRICFGR
jgi:hypothetical protein